MCERGKIKSIESTTIFHYPIPLSGFRLSKDVIQFLKLILYFKKYVKEGQMVWNLDNLRRDIRRSLCCSKDHGSYEGTWERMERKK